MKVKYIFHYFILVLLFFGCQTDLKTQGKIASENLLTDIADGNALKDFPDKYFKKDEGSKVLNDLKEICDFKSRRGNFINDFSEKGKDGKVNISFIYEYYLICDSIRFVITYELGKKLMLKNFHMEPIQQNNPMILYPERRLKF